MGSEQAAKLDGGCDAAWCAPVSSAAPASSCDSLGCGWGGKAMPWDAVSLPLACCIPGRGQLGHLWAPCSWQDARLRSGASAQPLASMGRLPMPWLCPGQWHAVQLRGLPAGCWHLATLDGVRGRLCRAQVGSRWAAVGRTGADPPSAPARVGSGQAGRSQPAGSGVQGLPGSMVAVGQCVRMQPARRRQGPRGGRAGRPPR